MSKKGNIDQATEQIAKKLKAYGYCIIHQFIKEFHNFDLHFVITALIQAHREKWVNQYQLLCCVVIKTENFMVIEYETYQNIFRGIIKKSNTHNEVHFDRKDIKELSIIAIYHQSIPFHQIKHISTSQGIKKNHKYINRFAPIRVIIEDESDGEQVAQRQPLPRVSDKRKRETLINNNAHHKANSKHQLMLTQSSDSEDYYFKKQEKTQKFPLTQQVSKKQINYQRIWVSAQQEKLNRQSKQLKKQMSQSKEKKISSDKYIQRKTTTRTQKTKYNPKEKKEKDQDSKQSKKHKLKVDLQKQSHFMSAWMQKTKNG